MFIDVSTNKINFIYFKIQARNKILIKTNFKKTMKIFFIFAIFLAIFQLPSQSKIISGRWSITNYNCPTNYPTIFKNLKISETNPNTSSVYINYFSDLGAEIYGNCTVASSYVSCGFLYVFLACNSNSLFQNITSSVSLSYDSTNNMALSMTFLWKDAFTLSHTCTYTGTQSFAAWQNKSLTVVNCTCGYGCCYASGSSLKMQQLSYDYNNYPFANVTGILQGDYCNGTLNSSDQCYMSTFIDSVNMTITNDVCNVMGKCSSSNSPPYFVWQKKDSMLAIKWDSCIMFAQDLTFSWSQKLSFIGIVMLIGIFFNILN